MSQYMNKGLSVLLITALFIQFTLAQNSEQISEQVEGQQNFVDEMEGDIYNLERQKDLYLCTCDRADQQYQQVEIEWIKVMDFQSFLRMKYSENSDLLDNLHIERCESHIQYIDFMKVQTILLRMIQFLRFSLENYSFSQIRVIGGILSQYNDIRGLSHDRKNIQNMFQQLKDAEKEYSDPLIYLQNVQVKLQNNENGTGDNNNKFQVSFADQQETKDFQVTEYSKQRESKSYAQYKSELNRLLDTLEEQIHQEMNRRQDSEIEQSESAAAFELSLEQENHTLKRELKSYKIQQDLLETDLNIYSEELFECVDELELVKFKLKQLYGVKDELFKDEQFKKKYQTYVGLTEEERIRYEKQFEQYQNIKQFISLKSKKDVIIDSIQGQIYDDLKKNVISDIKAFDGAESFNEEELSYPSEFIQEKLKQEIEKEISSEFSFENGVFKFKIEEPVLLESLNHQNLTDQELQDLKESIKDEVKEELSKDVQSCCKDGIKEAVQEDIKAEIKQEVEQDLKNEILSGDQDSFKLEVKDQLQQQIIKEVEQEIIEEVKQEVEQEFKENGEFKQQIQQEVISEIKEEVVQMGIKDQIQKEVKEEIKKKIENDINYELEQQQGSGYGFQVETVPSSSSNEQRESKRSSRQKSSSSGSQQQQLYNNNDIKQENDVKQQQEIKSVQSDTKRQKNGEVKGVKELKEKVEQEISSEKVVYGEDWQEDVEGEEAIITAYSDASIQYRETKKTVRYQTFENFELQESLFYDKKYNWQEVEIKDIGDNENHVCYNPDDRYVLSSSVKIGKKNESGGIEPIGSITEKAGNREKKTEKKTEKTEQQEQEVSAQDNRETKRESRRERGRGSKSDERKKTVISTDDGNDIVINDDVKKETKSEEKTVVKTEGGDQIVIESGEEKTENTQQQQDNSLKITKNSGSGIDEREGVQEENNNEGELQDCTFYVKSAQVMTNRHHKRYMRKREAQGITNDPNRYANCKKTPFKQQGNTTIITARECEDDDEQQQQNNNVDQGQQADTKQEKSQSVQVDEKQEQEQSVKIGVKEQEQSVKITEKTENQEQSVKIQEQEEEQSVKITEKTQNQEQSVKIQEQQEEEQSVKISQKTQEQDQSVQEQEEEQSVKISQKTQEQDQSVQVQEEEQSVKISQKTQDQGQQNESNNQTSQESIKITNEQEQVNVDENGNAIIYETYREGDVLKGGGQQQQQQAQEEEQDNYVSVTINESGEVVDTSKRYEVYGDGQIQQGENGYTISSESYGYTIPQYEVGEDGNIVQNGSVAYESDPIQIPQYNAEGGSSSSQDSVQISNEQEEVVVTSQETNEQQSYGKEGYEYSIQSEQEQGNSQQQQQEVVITSQETNEQQSYGKEGYEYSIQSESYGVQEQESSEQDGQVTYESDQQGSIQLTNEQNSSQSVQSSQQQQQSQEETSYEYSISSQSYGYSIPQYEVGEDGNIVQNGSVTYESDPIPQYNDDDDQGSIQISNEQSSSSQSVQQQQSQEENSYEYSISSQSYGYSIPQYEVGEDGNIVQNGSVTYESDSIPQYNVGEQESVELSNEQSSNGQQVLDSNGNVVISNGYSTSYETVYETSYSSESIEVFQEQRVDENGNLVTVYVDANGNIVETQQQQIIYELQQSDGTTIEVYQEQRQDENGNIIDVFVDSNGNIVQTGEIRYEEYVSEPIQVTQEQRYDENGNLVTVYVDSDGNVVQGGEIRYESYYSSETIELRQEQRVDENGNLVTVYVDQDGNIVDVSQFNIEHQQSSQQSQNSSQSYSYSYEVSDSDYDQATLDNINVNNNQSQEQEVYEVWHGTLIATKSQKNDKSQQQNNKNNNNSENDKNSNQKNYLHKNQKIKNQKNEENNTEEEEVEKPIVVELGQAVELPQSVLSGFDLEINVQMRDGTQQPLEVYSDIFLVNQQFRVHGQNHFNLHVYSDILDSGSSLQKEVILENVSDEIISLFVVLTSEDYSTTMIDVEKIYYNIYDHGENTVEYVVTLDSDEQDDAISYIGLELFRRDDIQDMWSVRPRGIWILDQEEVESKQDIEAIIKQLIRNPLKLDDNVYNQELSLY